MHEHLLFVWAVVAKGLVILLLFELITIFAFFIYGTFWENIDCSCWPFWAQLVIKSFTRFLLHLGEWVFEVVPTLQEIGDFIHLRLFGGSKLTIRSWFHDDLHKVRRQSLYTLSFCSSLILYDLDHHLFNHFLVWLLFFHLLFMTLRMWNTNWTWIVTFYNLP